MATTIPPRMHLPYARRVGRRGYPIRRAGWTDKWLRWNEGKWWYQSGATLRVLQAGDLTEEDWLAWDWTTLQVGCEGVNDAAALAELLRIRPYDVLTTAVDPLSLRCELPPVANTMEPLAWKDVAMPPVDERARPQPVRPEEPIPWPPRPSEPEWLPGRRRNRPVAEVGGGIPVLAFTRADNISSFLSPGFCVDGVIVDESPGGGAVTVSIGQVSLTGGPVGSYAVQIGLASGPSTIGTVIWSGTLTRGQTITFSSPLPSITFTFPWASTKTLLAQARLAGDLVASASQVMTMPGRCAPGS